MEIDITDFDKSFLVNSGIKIDHHDDEAEKYLDILSTIFRSGEVDIITTIKKALNTACWDINVIKEERQIRRTREGRDKIRGLLVKKKGEENEISKLKMALDGGLSSYGRPYAETTLKQMKSTLKECQKNLEKCRHELAAYSEEEIREAIEKEHEDKETAERERKIGFIKEADKKDVLWGIEYHERELIQCAKKLKSGVKTHGKYRGQPLSEQVKDSLKMGIAYHKEYFELYKVRLQELQEC